MSHNFYLISDDIRRRRGKGLIKFPDIAVVHSILYLTYPVPVYGSQIKQGTHITLVRSILYSAYPVPVYGSQIK